jgi:hypothetical protein
MRYWDQLAEYDREGFKIIVDKTWEDMHPRDCFDDSIDDIGKLCEQIDTGYYDWFMLRVRCLIDGHELSSEYLGGCLYESASDVLTDGTAEDIIELALANAKTGAAELASKLFLVTLRNSHTLEV